MQETSYRCGAQVLYKLTQVFLSATARHTGRLRVVLHSGIYSMLTSHIVSLYSLPIWEVNMEYMPSFDIRLVRRVTTWCRQSYSGPRYTVI